MAHPVRFEDIDALWQRFSGNRDAVSGEDLRQALADIGEDPDARHVRDMMSEIPERQSVTRTQFLATVASLRGDPKSRLIVAFDLFDEDGDRQITRDELRDVLLAFGIDDAQTARLLDAADADGSGTIGFDGFCALVPEDQEPHPRGLRDAHVSSGDFAPLEAAPPPVPNSSQRRDGHARQGEGTSRLQMQIGLFRLLQGAAYRSFRENFAANYESHLSAKTMPYKITDCADFTECAIALYKALGIVEPACFDVLDDLTRALREEIARLKVRIDTWDSVDKTPEMRAAATAMQAERETTSATRHVFGALVECALTLCRKNLTPADLAGGSLDLHELNRLLTLDLHDPPTPSDAQAGDQPDDQAGDYLRAWNRVILDTAEEQIDGAMMPSAFWYEDFMPKLLAACSVGSASDIEGNTVPDGPALDRWMASARAAGEFDRFGAPEMAHFETCRPQQKLMMRQAWRLTRHYLNGVQKQRERVEFGRDSGFLSQYIAFLDVYVGRTDVRDATMRVSFPYFIGPATWRFLHTTAEIICSRDAADQAALIALFKDFFRLFAAMYPCPYCRYHLNRYVVRNREAEYYPLEYLVLGCDEAEEGFDASVAGKLATITDGPSLRLFLWKLHNAVSSSITRTEAWFHRDERAFYASRYWPSLSEELARTRASGKKEVSVARLSPFSRLLTPVGRLASLRGRWRGMQMMSGSPSVATLLDDAQGPVRDLEEALAAGQFLERTYRFDPTYEDQAPHFTPEEEAYSRSGLFVEA